MPLKGRFKPCHLLLLYQRSLVKYFSMLLPSFGCQWCAGLTCRCNFSASCSQPACPVLSAEEPRAAYPDFLTLSVSCVAIPPVDEHTACFGSQQPSPLKEQRGHRGCPVVQLHHSTSGSTSRTGLGAALPLWTGPCHPPRPPPGRTRAGQLLVASQPADNTASHFLPLASPSLGFGIRNDKE